MNPIHEPCISEGYLVQNQPFVLRSEFQNSIEHLISPHFFSQTHITSSPPSALAVSLENFLKKIYQKHKNIYIPYSGGIDSELLIYTAIKLGIPYTPIIVNLFSMNQYELHYVGDFLKKNDISHAEKIDITEEDFIDYWLPNLIFDTESLSILLAGAYIAARSCPTNSAIVLSGENPNVFVSRDKHIFRARHEYSLWQNKVARRHHLQIFEAYQDPEVIKSYISYPAHTDRLNGPIPFKDWIADHEYLGKEYIYNDPDFSTLSRRYAQHGWEDRPHNYIYSKGMSRFIINKTHKPYIDPHVAIPFLLHSLSTKALDRDLAKDVFRKNHKIPINIEPLPKNSDFNKVFYQFLGTLGSGGFDFSKSKDRTTITYNSGEFEIRS